MKKTIFILTATATFFFISCKKSKTDAIVETQQTVNGYYLGKRNFDPSSEVWTNNYSILFKQDGTVRVYNLTSGTDTTVLLNLAKMDGTWFQNGSNLQVNYKPLGSPITITAAVNKSATEISGIWSFDGQTKGKFSIAK